MPTTRALALPDDVIDGEVIETSREVAIRTRRELAATKVDEPTPTNRTPFFVLAVLTCVFISAGFIVDKAVQLTVLRVATVLTVIVCCWAAYLWSRRPKAARR